MARDWLAFECVGSGIIEEIAGDVHVTGVHEVGGHGPRPGQLAILDVDETRGRERPTGNRDRLPEPRSIDSLTDRP